MKDNQLIPLHACCLEILSIVDEICRKNDIYYSLTGGSVIGWHLYRGFIPWDDDIDLMMTRENYDKFLQICQTDLPDGYSIRNFENGNDRTLLFSKVVNKNTTLVEKKSGGNIVIEGVFIDVTVFDKLPSNWFQRHFFFVLAKVVQCCMNRGVEGDSAGKALVKKGLFRLLRSHADSFYQFVKRKYVECSAKKHDYAELLAGFTIPYEKKLFDEYVDVEFEGHRCMLVKDYMYYLKTRYGKTEFYRDRKPSDEPHHFIYVDCNLPFREYIERKRESADNSM